MTLPYAFPDTSFWAGKKVLVTGHTGFKGSWLSLWLLQMKSLVSGVSLEPEASNNLFDDLKIKNDINHIICDIRDKDSLKRHIHEIKPDIVFHLAAQPLVVKSYIEPVNTWETNLMGTINVLDAISSINNGCKAIFITTDKVYKNNEWNYGYREIDELGGHDPYSSSKAACEIAISSWRSSFFKTKSFNKNFSVASARAGNVIGGGDFADNRIIPDVIRSLINNKKILVRNPFSTRPWQHVLEPLSGYLILAENLNKDEREYSSSFNFGPFTEANRTVIELVKESLKHWEGDFVLNEDIQKPHEAGVLNLSIEKSMKELQWGPRWDFKKTIEMTINWYKDVYKGDKSSLDCCIRDLKNYLES